VEVARDLKQKYPLAQFINDHVMTTRLQRAGNRWRGNCPVPDHGDTTPSFTVYPDDHWHCFGCNRNGDVYTLIGLIHGKERFSDQVRFLADCLGREVAS
jgi:DNA primase